MVIPSQVEGIELCCATLGGLANPRGGDGLMGTQTSLSTASESANSHHVLIHHKGSESEMVTTLLGEC